MADPGDLHEWNTVMSIDRRGTFLHMRAVHAPTLT